MESAESSEVAVDLSIIVIMMINIVRYDDINLELIALIRILCH